MKGDNAEHELGHILCSWGIGRHYNGGSTVPHGGAWEFTKERDDEVFSAIGDAVLVTEALSMACNAPLALRCLSKLCFLPLPPTLPPRFLGNTGLFLLFLK